MQRLVRVLTLAIFYMRRLMNEEILKLLNQFIFFVLLNINKLEVIFSQSYYFLRQEIQLQWQEQT